MFSFRADIIKRRRINVTALFAGMVGAGSISYLLPTFLQTGSIAWVEELIRQIGIQPYSQWVYIALFGSLLLMIIAALKTVFQKKIIRYGFVHFDEEQLHIVKGKSEFLIPEEDLQEVNFEIKKQSLQKKKNIGGSFLKIPTLNGNFICEIDIQTETQRNDLHHIAKVLKIQHDVKVNIKEIR
ncbi:MAG TPA: hypothetical protein ENJ45_05315 [Phaeodactylibacter sp.]|nr:hypothetical protein [Phaeodactylibacter sp.]